VAPVVLAPSPKKTRTQLKAEFLADKTVLVAVLRALGAEVKDTDKNGKPMAPRVYFNLAELKLRASAVVDSNERRLAFVAVEAAVAVASILPGAIEGGFALFTNSVQVSARNVARKTRPF
jgi:hypothetical protein